MRARRLSGVLGIGAAFVLAGACGSDSEGTTPGKDAGLGGGGSGGSGGGGAGDSGGDGPVIIIDGGDSGTLGCSADLRSVVDESGDIVETCPADQGCSGGKCVEACAAAAASHGNLGCKFLVPTPLAYYTTKPPCFALALANAWPKPAKLTVTRSGTTFDVTSFARIPVDGQPPASWTPVPATGIPADQVAVLFLSADPTSIFPENNVPMKCPVPTAVAASTMLDGTGTEAAFQVGSDVPVSAYDVLPFGGAQSHFPSAELLFPTSAWGVNYVVLGTPPGTHSPAGPVWLQILAEQDGTKVDLLPAVDLPAGGSVGAIAKNTTGSVTLSAGQYVQWELPQGTADVSGSIVLADKPVAVFTGNRFYRQQPTPGPGGESTHQQISAVSALGREYVGAPFATRRQDGVPEPIRYRFVGVVDGTTLSFDPALSGAPTSLARGQVADFLASEPFRVTSQDADHPFAAAQMMDTANVPSGSVPGGSAAYCSAFNLPTTLGDEEIVMMLPPTQFLSKYVFFTDPTYFTTHLVIARKKGPKGFADVKVDCLGAVSGWKPVGTSGEYELTTVDLVRGGVGVGTCTNGRHVADSAAPFGMTVWGLDCYSSYAYPAGGNAAVLTTVKVPPVPK
ncbi:MAG: IgGFc-binding protein [Polyangiaceae bacterium]|nr:IgGFc-binding protein [Polyangiaceae bacterium]MCL4749127.1 hypothetical protein [Myxococcales bacterium]